MPPAGVADTVVCMEAFRARDVTTEAHAIDARFGASPALGSGGGAAYGPVHERVPVSILPTSGDLSFTEGLSCSVALVGRSFSSSIATTYGCVLVMWH